MRRVETLDRVHGVRAIDDTRCETSIRERKMIVVGDMDMPDCCRVCQFAEPSWSNGIVTLSCGTKTGIQMYSPDLINRTDRPDWCPLEEIPECPPHTKEDIDEFLSELKQAMEELARIRETQT